MRRAAAVISVKARSYSTTFPLAKPRLSEGGIWINGGVAGADLWGDIQTKPGLAFGVSEPTKYGDPTAILKGAWGPDQTAQATVKVADFSPAFLAWANRAYRAVLGFDTVYFHLAAFLAIYKSVRRQDFDFYFDFVTALCARLLKTFGNE